MNKLKQGKGAQKDFQRYLADEYDDYAETPEEYDPISHLTQSKTDQIETISQQQKTQKLVMKRTSRWPKFAPEFDIKVSSAGILEGVFGEKLARYLKISDLVSLASTCQYFNRVFTKNSIWIHQLTKSHPSLYSSDSVLCSINIRQFQKYLRCQKQDGIVFDTLSMEKDMKAEDKLLARNLVDFVLIRSRETIEAINTLTPKGVLTRDLKISWIKDMNKVYVWVAGYSTRKNNIFPFACNLFTKEYKDDQSVQGTYFLNDRYFVIEIDQKDEEGSKIKTFEVFVIKSEPEWVEKKQAALCKQVLKVSFTKKEGDIKLKLIGDFLLFIVEENSSISVQVFNVNEGDKCLYKSEELHLDSRLSDVIVPRKGYNKENFNLYLIDQGLDVYLLNYSLESGVVMNKLDQQKQEQEEKKEELQLFHDKESTLQNERFLDAVKKCHYSTYKVINKEGQSETFEYLAIYKEKRFYLAKLETNELTYCDLPEYDIGPRLFNWTLCENYLYLLVENTIQIYQLDFLNCSAVLHRKEVIPEIKFQGSGARWILVNSCLTIVVSSSSFKESRTNALQLLIGSTQKLLMSRKDYNFDWYFDECGLYNILGHVDKWQDTSLYEQERVEWKFKDERLLIQTDIGTYFRDFNVCDKRVARNLHGWKLEVKFDLGVSSIPSKEGSKGLKMKEKDDISFTKNMLGHENKNHENSKKYGNQNWKNVEKKVETEEDLEKKENRKKGDKYYKNVRQGKHREKVFD